MDEKEKLRDWVRAKVLQRSDANEERNLLEQKWRELNPEQRAGVSSAALDYVSPIYSNHVIERAWQIAVRMDGLSQARVRLHLRELSSRGADPDNRRVIDLYFSRYLVQSSLPESFDIIVSWCQTAGAGRYYQEIRDRGCREFLAAFKDYYPEGDRWLDTYFAQQIANRITPYAEAKPVSDRIDLHDGVKKWLEDHPEARDTWWQRRLTMLRGIRTSASEDVDRLTMPPTSSDPAFLEQIHLAQELLAEAREAVAEFEAENSSH